MRLYISFKINDDHGTQIKTNLAIGPTVMVNIRCGSKPQLGTVFSTTVHYREVIFAWVQQLRLFLFSQFCYTSH